MTFIFLAVPVLAAAPLLQSFQDSDVEGLRFHRVYLINGNFIDGQLVKESRTSVILQVRVGEMTVRRDMIERIEFIKMRDRFQAPIPVKGPTSDGGKGADTGGKEDKTDRHQTTTDTPEAIKRKVDLILFKFKNSPAGEREIPVQDVAALGEEGAVYLAARIPAFDLKTQDAMGVALISLATLRRSSKVDAILEGYLTHEAAAVRSVSINVLGSTATEADKLRLFQPMLRDKDKRVRITVLSIIGSVQDSAWFDSLGDLSADADEEIRNRTLRILKNLADKNQMKDQLARLMLNNLRASDPAVQAEAIQMLSLLGMKEMWIEIAPMLRSSEPNVRSAAAQALTNFSSLEAADDVVAATAAERDRTVKAHLATALQKLRPIKAVEHLIPWLRDSDPEVQRIAEATLRVLTGENLGNDPDKWRDWWDKNRPK